MGWTRNGVDEKWVGGFSYPTQASGTSTHDFCTLGGGDRYVNDVVAQEMQACDNGEWEKQVLTDFVGYNRQCNYLETGSAPGMRFLV